MIMKNSDIYIYIYIHMSTWPRSLRGPLFCSHRRRYYAWSQWSARTFARDSMKASVWDGGICRDLWIGWGWMVTSGMVTRGFFILKWLILMSFKNRMIKNHWMIFVMILFVVLVLRWFWLCWSSCQLSCCSWFLNCFTVMTMMMMIIIRICLFSSCSSSSLATFSSS